MSYAPEGHPRSSLWPKGHTPEEWEQIKQCPLYEWLGEYISAHHSERAAVLVAHGLIEVIVNAVIDRTCKHASKITDDNRSYPHSVKLVILNELGVLNDHHYRVLDWLRKLRNEFAHRWDYKVDATRLSIFADPAYREDGSVYALCMDIVMDLWYDVQHLAGHSLMPAVYNKEGTAPPPPDDNYIVRLVDEPKLRRPPPNVIMAECRAPFAAGVP